MMYTQIGRVALGDVVSGRCLPSVTPPHTTRLANYRAKTPISARSEAALNAHALAVLEHHARIESDEENDADA